MASHFTVTATNDVVTLDQSTRQGEAAFTVTNQSDQTVWGRAATKALDAAAQPWLTIVDDAERPFQPGESLPYTVTIKVPPEASGRNYRFQLDMMDASSPVVTIAVPGAAKIPWRTIAIVAGVVVVVAIIIGVILLMNRPPQGPNDPTEPQWSQLGVDACTVTLAAPFMTDTLENTINTYRGIYPAVDVNLMTYPRDSYEISIQTMLVAGQGPDVFWIDDSLYSSIAEVAEFVYFPSYFNTIQWWPSERVNTNGRQVTVGNWTALNAACPNSTAALALVLAYNYDGVR